MFDCIPIKRKSSIVLLLSSGASRETLRLSLNKNCLVLIELSMLCDQMESLEERKLIFQEVLVLN